MTHETPASAGDGKVAGHTRGAAAVDQQRVADDKIGLAFWVVRHGALPKLRKSSDRSGA